MTRRHAAPHAVLLSLGLALACAGQSLAQAPATPPAAARTAPKPAAPAPAADAKGPSAEPAKAPAANPAPAPSLPGVTLLTERVVHDGLSGFALNGFDPVSFFLAGKPQPGDSRFELIWGGVAWRFASAANRAAFIEHPDIYAPRFGGHDPEALARGIPVAGSPEYFWVAESGLYLFHDEASREQARRDASLLARAAERWKEVESRLVAR